MEMEPSTNFWTYLILGVLTLTLVAGIIGVLVFKFFIIRPAEKRTRREAESDEDYLPMERGELFSLIQKLDDNDNIVAREVAKNKFLGEFRNELFEPLLQIRSTIANFPHSNEEPGAVFSLIDQKADKLEGLMSDLFELYTLEIGRAELAQERVDLGELLQEVETSQAQRIAECNNRLAMRLADDVTSVVSDRDKLRKLINHMVFSSNVYTLDGQIDLVVSFSEDGHLQIIVSDTGGGTPKAVDLRSWTGLRLPLIRKITEFLGGRFEFSDEAEGGSRCSAWINVRP